jgi:hypothetical protein
VTVATAETFSLTSGFGLIDVLLIWIISSPLVC